MMLVGEQPGDREDRLGHPFVGPAGKVLDTALERAQLERSKVFITNGVKHFKHRVRGKRRIHQRPSAAEVNACRPWLAAELELLAPEVIVALGATAAYSLLGRTVAIGEHRGRVLESELFARQVVVTAHPSSILRERDAGARRAALADDLGVAAQLI
jgi:uracil-DNA glycosylase family protein